METLVPSWWPSKAGRGPANRIAPTAAEQLERVFAPRRPATRRGVDPRAFERLKAEVREARRLLRRVLDRL